MVDPSYASAISTVMGGSWTLQDATDVPLNHGFLSQNVSFIGGSGGASQVQTRLGFQTAFDPNEGMSSLFNWISSLGNLLVWYRTGDRSVQLADITVLASATVIPGDLTGYAAIFADAGARLYAAFFGTNALGASGARVISFQSGTFVNDFCFQPPITYTPAAPTEPGAGTITQGLHYVGYRIEYRTGFTTRPSPDSGSGIPSSATFQPVAFTASGSKSARWTLNTAWPTGAVKVHVIMTPVSNPAQYIFVPGASADVVGGTTMSVTIDFDISDELLFANGTDSSRSLFLMTNTVSGVPQIYPSVAVTHGDRMVYVTTVTDNVGNESGALFVSEKQAYQEITPDTSLIQLPGLKDITTAISLDGTLYIFGPQWCYRTIDNGSEPSTWPAPALIDGRRGTLSPRGALVAPSGTYAWVASQDGLYFFQGAFSALPVSYYQQPDWDRINWGAAYVVQMVDDPSVKKVYVLVPLDSSTTPTHMLTWDYTNGYGPEEVQYSIDSIQSYDLGAMALVKNGLSGMPAGVAQKKEVWLGSSGAAPILRRNSSNDSNPYLDNGMPIFAAFETSLFPHLGTGRGEVYQHHGADYRVKGSGPVQITTYTIDHAQQYILEPIQLSITPGELPHRSFDMISEGVSHRISQGENLLCDPGFESGAGCP